MIVILHSRDCLNVTESIASDILDAFNGYVSVSLIAADSSSPWPSAASWDDLLLVVYDGKTFPDLGNAFIADYSVRANARLLPIALDLEHKKPPNAASLIKALEYDNSAKGKTGRIVHRAGCMLGLRIQGRESKIFISYRTIDGKNLAYQIYARFLSLGHRPYLDEAKEFDRETNILPGDGVQQQIDAALADASLVLLLDTPSAPSSIWIKHEVDSADAQLLPILPICFRRAGDPKNGPRFRSLLALQRWIAMELPNPASTSPLTDEQLDQIVTAAEKYQCEIFQRKCRVPFIVERHFLSHGFDWKEVDKLLLIFESQKKANIRLKTRVLSHCSIFDQIHGPAVERFRKYLNETGRSNYSLFIYDGDLLSQVEIEDIVRNETEELIILHHQELKTLISSNFTTLGEA
jgi:TIR domain